MIVTNATTFKQQSLKLLAGNVFLNILLNMYKLFEAFHMYCAQSHVVPE